MYILFYLSPSLPCWSKKTYVTLCFLLKVGRSAMACFCLLHSGYDMEVMILIRIQYGYDTTLFLLLLVDIVACDLYFVSHILLYLIITLILIIHINCINCISVGEYHGYSLTVYKSLL